MAKYNLLEDDDIFDEKNDLSSEDVEKEPESQNPENQLDSDIDFNIDDDILEDDFDIAVDEHDFHDELEQGDILKTEDEPLLETDEEFPEESSESEFVSYEPLEQEAETEPKADIEKPYITDDYADEKSPGLNYKPLIIGAVAILVIFFGWIAIDSWFLSDSDEETADKTPTESQQPEKTAQQILEEQTAARKTQFLSGISGQTSADIQLVNNAIQNAAGSAKISSILLYDKSLLFEVFGADREEVARVSMALKQKMGGNTFNVISSQTRPGSNGGVFGLFKADLGSVTPAIGGTNIQLNFSSVNDAENWLKKQSVASGLKVKTLQNHFIKDANDFQVFEISATVNGSMGACKGLLQKISSDGSQIKIHKLNLLAGDQKSFTSKNYQLKLILEIFV